ncbi:hypothetical protein BDY24DRAFT_443355 [Mrakia frigida]|uniref:uncharacterized protein n=1 Tax=Mrakia frigida TaxID=29902 RepID=UPI003FCC085D
MRSSHFSSSSLSRKGSAPLSPFSFPSYHPPPLRALEKVRTYSFSTIPFRAMTSQAEPTLLSLALLFIKPQGRAFEDFVEHLTDLKGLIPVVGMDVERPLSEFVAERERVVVLHLKNNGETASGGDFKSEYNVNVMFDEDKKIISVDEWVDSASVIAVLTRERKAAEERAAGKTE